MKKITIVSLGDGSRNTLTLGAIQCMRQAKCLVLRTGQCDAASYLQEQGIAFETLDFLHEESDDFDELIENCCNYVLNKAKKQAVVYGVFDAGMDETARRIRERAQADLLPGVPLAQPFLCAGGMTEAKCVSASGIGENFGDEGLLVVELDSRLLAGDVKLKLLDVYGENCKTLFFPPARAGEKRTFQEITLQELDRQKQYDHTCGALICPGKLTEKERYTFADLVRILRILRGENGDEWSGAQTHESLRKYLIEEAYEVCDAIEAGDFLQMAQELGDVLLQVVFQADIGRQYGTCELSDITTAICKKMIRRNPHVFLDRNAPHDWEELKRQEKNEGEGEALCKALPALMQADKVQAAAARVGFDFADASQALEKVYEEADEVRQELAGGKKLEEEIGDLFFSCVNVCRLSGFDSETALLLAVKKFAARFEMVKKLAKNEGKSIKDLTIDEMNVYWNMSKQFPEKGI